MNDKVKQAMINLITQMRGHIDAMEKDVLRERPAGEKEWDRGHGTFAVCLIMKGITQLAAEYCGKLGISTNMLEAADNRIDEQIDEMLKEGLIKKAKENPNAEVVLSLLSQIFTSKSNGADEDTKH